MKSISLSRGVLTLCDRTEDERQIDLRGYRRERSSQTTSIRPDVFQHQTTQFLKNGDDALA